MEKKYMCPKCSQLTAVTGEEWELDYNDPILECEHCGEPILRVGCREIGFSGIRFDDKLPVTLWALLPLLGGIILILLSLSFHGSVTIFRPKNLILGVLFAISGLYLIFNCLVNHRKKQAYLKAEVLRSKERCADPGYKEKLVALGYKFKKEKK